MNNNDIKIFSFFSGAGFLDLGFESQGYDIVFVNEYYKPFLDTYKFSRKSLKLEEPELGYNNEDIKDLINSSLTKIKQHIKLLQKQSKIVGFIGGPPCPDFSVGGKNKGRNGKNGILSLIYIQLITELQPDFFMFENVKGLWRTKVHRKFYEELKNIVHQSNYSTTEHLINAVEYGVPQDRERIIMLGFNNKLIPPQSARDLFGIEPHEINFPWNLEVKDKKEHIFSLKWPTKDPFKEDSNIKCPDNIPDNLTVEYWFKKNDVENHPNSLDYFKPRDGLKKMLVIDEGDDKKKSYKRLHRWRYSPTAAYGNNEVHLHPYKVRRISAAEAMSIQSLPKDFVLPEHISLSDKFKLIGNGVPYLASKGLAKAISKFIGAQYADINS